VRRDLSANFAIFGFIQFTIVVCIQGPGTCAGRPSANRRLSHDARREQNNTSSMQLKLNQPPPVLLWSTVQSVNTDGTCRVGDDAGRVDMVIRLDHQSRWEESLSFSEDDDAVVIGVSRGQNPWGWGGGGGGLAISSARNRRRPDPQSSSNRVGESAAVRTAVFIGILRRRKKDFSRRPRYRVRNRGRSTRSGQAPSLSSVVDAESSCWRFLHRCLPPSYRSRLIESRGLLATSSQVRCAIPILVRGLASRSSTSRSIALLQKSAHENAAAPSITIGPATAQANTNRSFGLAFVRFGRFWWKLPGPPR
jgi:hypothetical protein